LDFREDAGLKSMPNLGFFLGALKRKPTKSARAAPPRYNTGMTNEPSEKPPPSPYCGMTTNERLFSAGLLDEFDAAAIARDREKMVALLLATDVLSPTAEHIADVILGNPAQYGF
jgi:hypothetical protein